MTQIADNIPKMAEAWQRALDAHAIVSVADASGNIIYANSKFSEVSQYSVEELLGSNHRILNSGYHPKSFWDAVWQQIRSGRVWHGEVCNRRKDGTLYWVETTIVPSVGDDGLPYQYISLRTEITAIKRQAEMLRLQAQAMEASVTGIAIALATEPEQPLIYVNRAFERITGYARDEVVGRNCRFLQGGDSNQPGIETIRAAIRQGNSAQVLLRNYRKDGVLFWNEFSIAPVHDEQGNLTHFIGLSNDVTERVRAQEALLEAKAEVERASQAKSEFLSQMSHELRTPLNAVLGFAQLVESDPEHPLAPTQQESVGQILKAGWHLLDLINEVLDLARIESGGLHLSIGPVNWQEVLQECLFLMAPLAEERAISIENAIPEAIMPLVEVDRKRLKQVLLNLLSNAIKYNRMGGRIYLTGVDDPQSGRIRLSVRDTGEGIPAELMAEMFQPFNRLGAEKTAVEGTGVGLVIVRRLLEMMRGTVEVESEVGVGTVFTISLPYVVGTQGVVQ